MWDCYHELLGRSWVLRSFHSLDLFSSHFGGQLLIGGFFSPKSPVDWNLFKIRDPPHLTYINGKKCKKLTNWFSLDSSRVTLASSWAFLFSSCAILVSYIPEQDSIKIWGDIQQSKRFSLTKCSLKSCSFWSTVSSAPRVGLGHTNKKIPINWSVVKYRRLKAILIVSVLTCNVWSSNGWWILIL